MRSPFRNEFVSPVVYRANRATIESERRDDVVPLQPRQDETGEPDSLSDTDSDGPSRLREDREIFRSVEVKGPTALRLRRQPLQSS